MLTQNDQKQASIDVAKNKNRDSSSKWRIKHIITVVVPAMAICLFVSAIPHASCAQHIFPEKFTGCNTDRFALEKDSTRAKIDANELMKVLVAGIDERAQKKIRGTLSLQIIVDLQGRSCLISMQNDTNIKSTQLKLKNTIDQNLVWTIPHEKVAAIVALRFEKKGVRIKRLGFDANRGMHELID